LPVKCRNVQENSILNVLKLKDNHSDIVLQLVNKIFKDFLLLMSFCFRTLDMSITSLWYLWYWCKYSLCWLFKFILCWTSNRKYAWHILFTSWTWINHFLFSVWSLIYVRWFIFLCLSLSLFLSWLYYMNRLKECIKNSSNTFDNYQSFNGFPLNQMT
jgi:hypothetical protein